MDQEYIGSEFTGYRDNVPKKLPDSGNLTKVKGSTGEHGSCFCLPTWETDGRYAEINVLGPFS